MENKPASSLVVSLGKALDKTLLPSLCARQVAQTPRKCNSQASADRPEYRDTIRFLVNKDKHDQYKKPRVQSKRETYSS